MKGTLDYVAMGRRIRDKRKWLKLKQWQLAERANVSLSFLGHIERGTRVMSLDTFARLCNALELNAHVVLFGAESRQYLEATALDAIKEILRRCGG